MIDLNEVTSKIRASNFKKLMIKKEDIRIKKGHSTEKIIYIMKEAVAGMVLKELCRKHNVNGLLLV